MNSYPLEALATERNFDEEAYLKANPDVAAAVRSGRIESGYQHFQTWGKKEERKQLLSSSGDFITSKEKKLFKIKPILRNDTNYIKYHLYYDFMNDELRKTFNIVETEAVSSHGYDNYAMELIRKFENGWVLDCGAGRRPIYFDHVVNFEIVPYDSTDVCGVGEVLPFIDESFDAVISIAVLEHVKDPFLCAKEISRVLKPGGSLMCCVPFLQPLHGYPHHYYNMSSQGLENLFADYLEIDKISVYDSILPIWTLTWILNSWANGLKGKTRNDFLNMKISDLLDSGDKYVNKPFVKELSLEKNLELASATVLFAHKE